MAEGRATGVTLEDGTEIPARIVLSNADPKRTFLGLVDKRELAEEFRRDVATITMAGPCAKVNFALDREPDWRGMPADADPNRRSLATSSRRSSRRSARTTCTARGRSPTSCGSTA